MHHHLFLAALAALYSTVVVGETPGLAELSAPAGFSSANAAKLAVLTGQVALIDLTIPVPESISVQRGIVYGQGGREALQLDLYAPKSLSRPVPGLIFVHGGGWKSGKREDYHFYCVKFAERGYVVATISYRLLPAAFPAAIQDVKCAVRWMRTEAKRLNVREDAIGLVGGSAGGHLAMLAGYASARAELEGSGGHREAGSRVQAVVNLYGPCNLTVPAAAQDATVINFLDGKQLAAARAQYELASPITHITPDDPPTLILHGTVDEVVPISQSDELASRLAEVGIVHRYERLVGWPHTMDLAQDVNDYCRRAIEEFLEQHLGTP